MAKPTNKSSPPTGRGRTDEERTVEAQAKRLKDEGRETAAEAKTQAKEKAQELKSEAREKGEDLKRTVAGEVDAKSSEAAERLDSVIRALQTAADRLDEDGEGWLSGYVRQAAGQVDRLTGYLRDRDAGRMLGDLEDMARESPGTFLGTSFASGVAVGRFLRSSPPSEEGETAEPDSRGYGGYEAGGEGGEAGSTRTSREAAHWSSASGGSGEAGESGRGGAPMGVPEAGVRTGSAARASDATGTLSPRRGDESTRTRGE